ncbi:MAG: hypothetical protein LBK77_05210 [Spirochaetaceae bacterium]|jgi:hypothetical protein|nr:hypothetical protein [Spirochaetaceae bacterium]
MCWYCGDIITEPEPIGRSLYCSCGKDLRSCRNCRFYLTGARGDCSETNAEPQSDKERGNFCDWFSLNPRFRSPSPGEQKDRGARSGAKAAFDGLFNG